LSWCGILRSAKGPLTCEDMTGREYVWVDPGLGPVSKSGWLLSWGDCPVRVMIADNQGCDLRSEGLVWTAGAGVVQGTLRNQMILESRAVGRRRGSVHSRVAFFQ
jgi:hypothetical protein